MEEIWKDVYYFDCVKNEWVDYRGLYQVSSDGKVKSLNYKGTGQERILKCRHRKDGYFDVMLYKNGKYKSFKIHRLVAFAFLINDEPLIKTQVNHKDENKENNRVNNLEWCTREYNINYGNRTKKASESNSGENHPKARKVILLNTGEVFDYIKQAEEKYKVANGNISHCCNGRIKSAGKDNETGEKLVWMYLEDYEKMEKLKTF